MSEREYWKTENVSDFQEIAEQINEKHTALISNTKLLISQAVEIGGLLSQVKENGKHGEFEQWLEQHIKFNTRTARNYLSVFKYQNQITGASNLTEAYKLIETLEAQKKKSETQNAYERVAEYRKTGKKPEGWRQHTDDKLAQEEEERDKRIDLMKQESLNRKQEEQSKAREREAEQVRIEIDTDSLLKFFDHESEAVKKRTEFKEAIRLSAEGMQDPFQDALLDYLEGLENDSRRIEACHNIIKVCKRLAAKILRFK